MINGKSADSTMEVSNSKHETTLLRKEDEEEEDDVSSSSSSDEESDVDELAEPEKPQGNSAVELTLKDDDYSALIQPEDEEEADETQTDSSKLY